MTSMPADVTRPKGIPKDDWDAWIALLDAYQTANPTDPDYDPETAAVAITDMAVELFLAPLP